MTSGAGVVGVGAGCGPQCRPRLASTISPVTGCTLASDEAAAVSSDHRPETEAKFSDTTGNGCRGRQRHLPRARARGREALQGGKMSRRCRLF